MAVSIDSSNFRKWRIPKLHRRRGCRSSSNKLPSTPKIQISLIPEITIGDEKEIPVDSVIKKLECINHIEKPIVNLSRFGNLALILVLTSLFIGTLSIYFFNLETKLINIV